VDQTACKYSYPRKHREAWIVDGKMVTVDAAMRFVLVHNLTEETIPSLDELETS